MTEQQEREELKLPPIVDRLSSGEKLPICLLVVGMAGSGKTTLLRQLQLSLLERRDRATAASNSTGETKVTEKANTVENETVGNAEETVDDKEDEDDDDDDEPFYCVNLDPACLDVPYTVHIDIRDTVDYSQVMQQHQLGPNGAILTSLNLLASKFDQVLSILERRCLPSSDTTTSTIIDYILIDTPGQIEAFTWSASGSLMSQALASAFPTVLVFVVDTARCAASPNTFMSNMLYCCSMVYRTRLPVVVCCNKNDVVHHSFCLEWMQDYEAFQQALDDTDEGYYSSLTRSLSMVLDEFYSGFAHACGVSAVTGAGMDSFWEAVDAAKEDFATDFVQDLKDRTEENQARRKAMARVQARRLQRDMGEGSDDT